MQSCIGPSFLSAKSYRIVVIIKGCSFKVTYHWPKADHEFFDLVRLGSIDHREVSELLVVLRWQIEAEVVEIENVFGLLVKFLVVVDYDVLFGSWLCFIIVQDIHEGVLEDIICSILFCVFNLLVLC